MAKKLVTITSRLTPEEREDAFHLAEVLGCTPSRLVRSLLAREIGALRVPGTPGPVGRLVQSAERFAATARAAAADGHIDSVERAELTTIQAESLGALWPGQEAA